MQPFVRPLSVPFNVRNETGSSSLNIERAVVRSVGGTPNKRLLGPDGTTSGPIKRPLEVKYANKDPRFRVNRLDHERMLRENGIYIFVNSGGQQVRLTPQQVSSLLRYKWLHDRNPNFQHSFVMVKDIFG